MKRINTDKVLADGEKVVTALNIAENTLSALVSGGYIVSLGVKDSIRKDLRKIKKAREIAEEMWL